MHDIWRATARRNKCARLKYSPANIPMQAIQMDDATENEIRVLKQENESLRYRVDTLQSAVDALMETVDSLIEREPAMTNEGQEYVAAKNWRDPSVG